MLTTVDKAGGGGGGGRVMAVVGDGTIGGARESDELATGSGDRGPPGTTVPPPGAGGATVVGCSGTTSPGDTVTTNDVVSGASGCSVTLGVSCAVTTRTASRRTRKIRVAMALAMDFGAAIAR